MANNIDNWIKQVDGNISLVLSRFKRISNEAGQELYDRIKERTPIGDPTLWKSKPSKEFLETYVPGRLKAAWTITFLTDSVRIFNVLPYAERVEFGWSYLQAPAGMVRISLQELPDIFRKLWK